MQDMSMKNLNVPAYAEKKEENLKHYKNGITIYKIMTLCNFTRGTSPMFRGNVSP